MRNSNVAQIRRIPLSTATNALVLINVLAYVWESSTGAFSSDYALLAHGAIYGPLVTQGQWWRIVTGAFLHGGLLHVGFNMFALYQVGTFLEMLVGAPRMLIVYMVSLVGSGIAVVLFNYNEVTVGASGAIFGIFGALVAIGLRLGRPGRGLMQQTLPIIVINLAIGFTIPNISSVGHIGGLVSGFVAGLAMLMLHQAPQRPQEVSEFSQPPAVREDVSAHADEAAHESTETPDDTVEQQTDRA
ncbi:MAG: rhomboid family intramembrane serine protease [Candidatus Eremiobacteraeota bacterium]|nr:rhomboid family intramembrane serine protease [Candidatus Eremiobacteraeota bacterium]